MDKKLLIVCPPRSGSELLRGALNCHSSLDVFGEVFNTTNPFWVDQVKPLCQEVYGKDNVDKEEDQTKLAERVLQDHSGFKILYHQLGMDNPVWSYLKHFKIIHLTRGNFLDALVSTRIAQKTNIWHRYLKHQIPKHVPLELSYEETLEFFQWSLKAGSAFSEFFLKTHCYKITYDQLVDDFEATTNKIQQFLGVNVEPLRKCMYKRVTKKKSDIITNYNELKNQFKDSKWISYFNE